MITTQVLWVLVAVVLALLYGHRCGFRAGQQSSGESARPAPRRATCQFDPRRLTDFNGGIIWSDWNPVSSEGNAAVADDGHANDIFWCDDAPK